MTTILLVEEEPIFRDFIKLQLVGRYGILEADSPVEALDICRAQNDIDMLICDADIGLISGPELASLVRAWVPRIRTILLSDLPRHLWSDRQVMEFKELPEESALILSKPFTPRQLEAALMKVANEEMTVGSAA